MRFAFGTLALLLATALAPAHTGAPPQLPETTDVVLSSIPSTGDVTNTGTTWCSHAIQSFMLRATKNGTLVSLTFNSITTQNPHADHTDHVFDIDLDPLNLQTGDVITWYYKVKVGGVWYQAISLSTVQ